LSNQQPKSIFRKHAQLLNGLGIQLENIAEVQPKAAHSSGVYESVAARDLSNNNARQSNNYYSSLASGGNGSSMSLVHA